MSENNTNKPKSNARQMHLVEATIEVTVKYYINAESEDEAIFEGQKITRKMLGNVYDNGLVLHDKISHGIAVKRRPELKVVNSVQG